MDYIRLARRLGVRVKVRNGVLDKSNSSYSYSDLALRNGEAGPMPTEEEFQAEHDKWMQERQEKRDHARDMNSKTLSEFKEMMMDPKTSKKDALSAIKKLIDEVQLLKSKL